MRKTKDIWPLWMGIKGFRFVYHGDWSDPEVVWHGHVMNAHALEDAMWELYEERCKEEEVKTTEDGFVQFCKDEVECLREFAQNLIDCGQARRFDGRLRYRTDWFSKDAPVLRAIPA